MTTANLSCTLCGTADLFQPHKPNQRPNTLAMAEDGGAMNTSTAGGDAGGPAPLGIEVHHQGGGGAGPQPIDMSAPLGREQSAVSPRVQTPNPFSRQHTSLDLDDYFVSLTSVLLRPWPSPYTARPD